jgi:fructose-bisphosphate aldolase, class II
MIVAMKKLREYILEARKEGKAIGHFNISNMEAVWAIFRAAKKVGVPVIIGVSEGERDFFGVKQIAAVVKSIREEHQYPIFLNADHTYSFERVKEAVDAGFDAVIFDATEVPFDENVAITRKCVEYAKSVNPDIVVESELGFIGKSSKVLDAIPEGVKITEEFLTKPEEAARFVRETGVDMLAPAVGNIHGMLKGGKDPALNIKRVGEISAAAGVPLVLHGGSGSSIEDFLGAIAAGVAVVHINTEIRVAYRDALKAELAAHPLEVAPYKILKPALEAVERVVEEKLRLFSNPS